MKYLKRTYRITPAQDKWVKKNKKKYDSESGFIRQLISYNERPIVEFYKPPKSS